MSGAGSPAVGGAPVSAEDERLVSGFVYAEARLLDEQRFDEWLELFDESGYYWVPAQVGQPGPERALSLFYEHKPLLAVRIARLQEATPHARTPASRTHHQVSALSVQRALTPGADFEAISSLIVCEWRQDEGRWFAGTVRHGLRRHEQTLRITFKEVRLINCDAPHRALMVPF